MIRRVILRPAAEADLQEAYEWYEQREGGLGAKFLDCVHECFQAIRRHPEMYPAIHEQTRQGLVRRFPYRILYFRKAEDIVVVSVFHAARDPKIWKRRS